MEFQRETFAAIWEEAQGLLSRHWDEVACKSLCGELDVDEAVYHRMEDAGALHITTAREYGKLVGYAAYFLAHNPHYQSKLMAEPDVFFLLPQYRKGLAGLRLLQAAERGLVAQGVHMIIQKVKTAHDCGAIFRRMGYSHVENVWMKGVV